MSWIKSNLTGLLSFLVVVLTAVQGLKDFGLVSDLQLVALIVSSFVVIIVPLAKVAWAGALKTSLDLLGAALVIAIPFVALWVAGAPVTKDAIVLMIIGFVKAGATEFGVRIRTDWGATTPKALIDAGMAPTDATPPTPVITLLAGTPAEAEVGVIDYSSKVPAVKKTAVKKPAAAKSS